MTDKPRVVKKTESKPEETPQKSSAGVSRRDFLVGTGTGVAGLVVGGLVGYQVIPQPKNPRHCCPNCGLDVTSPVNVVWVAACARSRVRKPKNKKFNPRLRACMRPNIFRALNFRWYATNAAQTPCVCKRVPWTPYRSTRARN